SPWMQPKSSGGWRQPASVFPTSHGGGPTRRRARTTLRSRSFLPASLLLPGCLNREVLLQEVGHQVGSFVCLDFGETAVIQAEEVHVALCEQLGQIVQSGPHGGVHIPDLGAGLRDGRAGEKRVVVVERVGH